MRRILYLALLLVAPIYGQTTSVTATLTDSPDGTLWVNGSCTVTLQWSITKYPITTPYRKDLGPGTLVPQKPPCTVNGSGVMSVTVTDVAFIYPPNSTWSFSVCPNVYQGNTGCGVTQVAVTGASIDLTGVLKVPSPRVGGGIASFAYADVEVAPLLNNFYWNTTLGSCRTYTTAWGSCPVGGGGGPGGTTTQGQYNNNGSLAGSPGFTFNTSTGIPASFKLTNPGVFSNTASNFPNTTTVNGCDLNAIFQVPQFTQYLTAAVSGCATGPINSPGTGYNQTTGGFFAATASGVGTGTGQSTAVGVYTTALITGDNTKGFGDNPLVEDYNDSATGQTMVGQEVDVQPQKPSSAYAFGGFGVLGTNYGLFNQGGQGGTYGPSIYVTATSFGTPAYWGNVVDSALGSLGPSSVAFNINAIGTATSAANYNCPILLNAYETYWTGSASANAQWAMGCYTASGTNPSTDNFYFGHQGGPTGQTHTFEMQNGIQLQLDGSTSGNAIIAATPTGGGLSVTAPSGASLSAAGTFNTTSNNSYVNGIVGGCQPFAGSYIANNASYYNVQFKTNMTASMTGCVLDQTATGGTFPALTGGGGAVPIGMFGAAASNDNTADAVGGYFNGFALANGVHAFGINPVAQDIAGLTANVNLLGGEFDVQTFNGVGTYSAGAGITVDLINQTNQGGTFPFSAIQTSARVNGGSTPAFWKYGINGSRGSFGSSSVVFNIDSIGTATSSANFNCPTLFNAYENYWTGSAAQAEGWTMGCYTVSGTNPSTDNFFIGHTAGTAPSGQTHRFELQNGTQVQLDGSTSGNVFLAPSATGGALIITAPGGVSVPAVNQPAASTWAGSCAMSTGTTCTVTLAYTFTTPICMATVQGTTPIAGACSVSGNTATITAASSNSATWAVMVLGNPN